MAVKKPVTTDDVKPAAPVEDGYTRVVSPVGIESVVPDSILAPLIEAGYTKK